ncbi:MAG: SMR family transporter [Planctomycetota bacterium]
MFILLLTCSAVAYALQNTLIAAACRRNDVLAVVTWRGLSLAVLMVPLLCWADVSAFARLGAHLLPLAGACCAGASANLFGSLAVRHLSVGIANAVFMSVSTVATALFAILFHDERPSAWEFVGMGVIIGCVVLLTLSSRRRTRPVATTAGGVAIGVVCACMFGLLISTAVTCLLTVTREVDPFIAAWAWEGGIGAVALVFLLLRRGLRRAAVVTLSARETGLLALAVAPTAVGTGCYTVGTAHPGSSLAVAGAMLGTIMIFSAVFARLVYGERLTREQWLAVAGACAAIVLFQLTSA